MSENNIVESITGRKYTEDGVEEVDNNPVESMVDDAVGDRVEKDSSDSKDVSESSKQDSDTRVRSISRSSDSDVSENNIVESITGRKYTEDGVEEVDNNPVESMVDDAVGSSDSKDVSEDKVESSVEGIGSNEDRTRKQKAIERQLERINEMEKGGFTENEKHAIKAGQAEIEQAEQLDELKDARKEFEEDLRREEDLIKSNIERLEDADDVEEVRLASDEGSDVVSREEAIDYYEGRMEALREEEEQVLQEIDTGEMESKASVEAIQSHIERYRETDPKAGRTTEDFIDEHRGKVSVLTGFQPEGFEVMGRRLVNDDEGAYEAIEGMVDEIRADERTPVGSAGRAVLSPPGTVGATAAGGYLVKSGVGAATAFNPGLGMAAETSVKALGGSLLAGAGLDIAGDIREGDYGEATTKGLRYGAGAAGFMLGGAAAGKSKVLGDDGATTGRAETVLVDKGAGKVGKGRGRVSHEVELPGPKKQTRVGLEGRGKPPSVKETGPTVKREAAVDMDIQASEGTAHGAGKVAVRDEGSLTSVRDIALTAREGTPRKVSSKVYDGSRIVSDTGEGREFGHVLSDRLITAQHADKTVSVNLGFSGAEKGRGTITLGKKTVYDDTALDVTDISGKGSGGSNIFQHDFKHTIDGGEQVMQAAGFKTSAGTGVEDQAMQAGVEQAQKILHESSLPGEKTATATTVDTRTTTSETADRTYQANIMTEQVSRDVSESTGFDTSQIVLDNTRETPETGEQVQPFIDTGIGQDQEERVSTAVDTRTRTGTDTERPQVLGFDTGIMQEERSREVAVTGEMQGVVPGERNVPGTGLGTDISNFQLGRSRQMMESMFQQQNVFRQTMQPTSQLMKKSSGMLPGSIRIPFPGDLEEKSGFAAVDTDGKGRVSEGDRGVPGDFISHSLAQAQFARAETVTDAERPQVLGFDIRSVVTRQEREEGFDLDIF